MSESIIKLNGAVIRQQKNTILKNVNIDIKSGEFVYLIGKVGSGKSSLLKTLYAELPLEYGSGEVAGFQLKKIKKSQVPLLRRKCGIVFQDFKLLIDRNVYANLEFVLKATGWNNKKAIQERIGTVLEKVGMLDKKDKMPHQLSGGEQQRIVLARALLNAPPIILADEPTGNIDPETSYLLIQLLKEICDTGKTVVIATHQYDLIEKYPGRVLRCQDGEMIEVISEQQAPADGEIAEEQIVIIEQEIEAAEEALLKAEKQKATEESNITEQEAESVQDVVEELTFTEIISFDEDSEDIPATAEEAAQPAAEEVATVEESQPIEEEKQPELPFASEEQSPVISEQEPEQIPNESKEEDGNKEENAGDKNDPEKKEGQVPPPIFGFELID